MAVLISAALTMALVLWLEHTGWLWQWQWQVSLQQVSPSAWCLVLTGLLISYGLRAWRIRCEFAEVGGMNFVLALRIVLAHTALVHIMPMRSGELGFPWLMRRVLNVAWLDAAASLLWLRMQDAMVLAVLAIWFWPSVALPERLMASLLLCAGIGLALFWMRKYRLRLETQTGLLARLSMALARRSQNQRQSWLICGLNWTLKLGLQAWLLAQLLQQSWSVGWAGALGAELSALSPVQALGGFGSYEAGSAAALRWHGVSWELGLQAGLALHLVMLTCALGFGLLAWWLPKPLMARHNGT